MGQFVSDFENIKNPKKFISLMYEKTDANGILYIPGWYYLDEPKHSYRCKINWDSNGFDKVMEEFEDLYRKLINIGNCFKNGKEKGMEMVKNNKPLFKVYNTYLKDFEYAKASAEKIAAIKDKYDTITNVNEIARKFKDGEAVEQYELDLYKEYKDTKVSKAEADLYNDYNAELYADCEKRIGSKPAAIHVIMRAKRIAKLVELGAPRVIVSNEACNLASAYVVHKFATSIEQVSDVKRLEVEKLDDDDYLDSVKEKKTNNRKTLVPIFVYFILKEKTNAKKHMTQKELIEEIFTRHEVEIERKALGRIVHSLAVEYPEINYDQRKGIWFE